MDIPSRAAGSHVCGSSDAAAKLLGGTFDVGEDFTSEPTLRPMNAENFRQNVHENPETEK